MSSNAFLRKNKWNYPLQFFVGLTNEHKIVPMAVAGMRSERKEDFLWLLRAFYRCYGTLPKCMIVDGDENISNAIHDVAQENQVLVTVLLCIWHLFMSILRALGAKNVPVEDELKLKKALYGLQRCTTEAEFDAQWTKFVECYGKNDAAVNYLNNSVLAKKHQWAHHATGRVFSAGMAASSISESFHSLLASGRSHFNKLHEILILVDRILIQQLQESRKLSDQWEASIPSLSLRDGMGFAGVAVSGLLSGKGWRLLGRSFEASLYMSVSPTEATDDFATRAFRVIDGRFPESKAHTVHVGPLDKYGRGAEYNTRFATIKSALSKDMSLGVSVCSGCGSAEAPETGEPLPFDLPPKWELLYQGHYRLKRVIVALGFGIPKEPGSTNNVTTEGLTSVIMEYQSRLQDYIALGFCAEDARAKASEEMTAFVYGERALGRPRVKKGAWLQCGVLDGEEVLPEGHKRNYCGRWYHFSCTGIMQESKATNDRVQCLECLQEARFRPKVAPIDHAVQVCMYAEDGSPRILVEEPKSPVRTLHLLCDCSPSITDGIPCSAMMAVARTCNALISYHSFWPQWWSSKILLLPSPSACFVSNERFVFDIKATLAHGGSKKAPSHKDASIRAPDSHDVTKNGSGEGRFIVWQDDQEVEAEFKMEGITIKPVSTKKNSRRFKAKKPKKQETK